MLKLAYCICTVSMDRDWNVKYQII